MDYPAAIDKIYDYIATDDVANALRSCLRISRNLKDYLNSAVFLRELYTDTEELKRSFYNDVEHLKPEAQEFFWKRSSELWLATHTVSFLAAENADLREGERRNVVGMGPAELQTHIVHCEELIRDLDLPSGRSSYDGGYFADRNSEFKAQLRTKVRAIVCVKERIKDRCFNYASNIERQLNAQQKSENFLHEAQSVVNNYFKAHGEEVFSKLEKASELVCSKKPEDYSLLLASVRRAIKAAADHFYPPVAGKVKCADGKERAMGNDEYMNRLQEFLRSQFSQSASRDLLLADTDFLAVIARKLNDIASKGVHADVSLIEAKQGLVSLYMFLFNVVSLLQNQPNETKQKAQA